MTHTGHLAEVERLLETTLRAGYLQAIAKSPRMDMRYKVQLMPVARAQRVATHAIERLAAHSEDWHCRTVSGVQPARLLSEVSEDDFMIYENVVFVRLLDQCHRLLANRIRELRRLRATRRKALALSNPEHLHHRLRRHLCELWGQAMTRELQTSDSIHKTLMALERMLNKVSQMRHSPLYRSIPRQRCVPLALRTTNVLLHDPNYCQPRPLWREAHAGVLAQSSEPAENFARQARLYRTYADYLGLLIQHALLSFCARTFDAAASDYRYGPGSIKVTRPSVGEWCLTLGDRHEAVDSFTFIASWKGCGNWSCAPINRQVVYCHPEIEEPGDSTPASCGQDAVLNPLQFYSVERVRARIEQWLLSRLARSYPPKVKGLSSGAIQLLTSGAPQVFRAAGREVIVLPHSPTESAEIDGLLASMPVGVDSAQRSLRNAVGISRQLASCRVCGFPSKSDDLSADHLGFRWRCRECSLLATLTTSGVNRRLTFRFGDSARPFDVVGALEAEVIA